MTLIKRYKRPLTEIAETISRESLYWTRNQALFPFHLVKQHSANEKNDLEIKLIY